MTLRRRLRRALAMLAFMLAFGTVGYILLEDASILDALYMTVITVSTVGYGEVVQGLEGHPAGRIFTMVLIFGGIGLLAYSLSVLTTFFVEGELTDMIRRNKMDKQIARLEDHFILCGLGSVGSHIARELGTVGLPFVAIEMDESRVQAALEHQELNYLIGDATHDEMLKKAGIERARGMITVLSNDRDNLFVIFTIRQINPDIRIVSRCADPAVRDRLIRAGANAVVFPEQIGGMRVVSEMVRPHVVSFLDRMLRPSESEIWRIEEVEIRPDCHASGKRLGELDIGKRVGIPVLALTGPDPRSVSYYPGSEAMLGPDMRLVVLAEKAQVDKLRQVVKQG